MKTWPAASLCAILLALTACASDRDEASAADGPSVSSTRDSLAVPTPVQSEQASDEGEWGTPYSETYCADFDNRMDDEQQLAVAEELFVANRLGVDDSSAEPMNSQIEAFRADMLSSCMDAHPELDLIELSWAVYTMDYRL